MALLDAAGAEASGAPGLELRAMAAYGNGDYEVAVSAWEQLYELHIREGDRVRARRDAGAMAAMFLLIDTGLMATVRGWLRRVERLLVGGEETPAARVGGGRSDVRAVHVRRHARGRATSCSGHRVG